MSQKVSVLASTDGAVAVESSDDAWEWILRIAIVLGLGLIIYSTVVGKVFNPLVRAAENADWMHAFLRPSILWMTMGSLLLGFRTFLWFRYRPFSAATMPDAPALTVIIPAYNEGAMVAQTIDSVAAARYPRERLEIFVVDDGSRDDTWEHIQAAAMRHPELVTLLRFAHNRGKRAALEAGFRRARGEVVVTIDSDSVIERNTLLAIAGPFRNPKVGAVAGKVSVYNQRDGLIPRMLQVRFVLSFDVLRAVQSTYGTVNCCPGALSAYRISVVREVLDQWVAQKFLGVPSTYGEDRALTNFILARGHDTVYQRTAVVHTIVPQSYKKLCKMYLRWDRSFVREELRFAGIVWKRPLKSLMFSLVDNVITNLRYPVGYVIFVLLIVMTLAEPKTILRVLFAIGAMSSFYMLYYLRSERSWKALYGVFYAYFSFFTLFWVFPYAVLTVRARSWLTR
jgi:hyaluronan synthase